MQLRHYLRMILKGWWIIALTSLTGLVLALSAAYNKEPRYRTSARMIVSPNPTLINSGQFIYSIDTLDKRSIVTTYSEVLNSSRLFAETGAMLQLSPTDLAKYSQSAVVIPEANILELYVDGPNPDYTALITNGLADRAVDYVQEVYQVYDLEILDAASVPTDPYLPKPSRDAALAGVLGAVLGAALAILEQQLRLPLEALRRRSMFDQPSQAYNRRTFEKEARQILNTNGAASVVLIEFDGLQDIIESLPPPVSQKVLRTITKTFRQELRGSDVIGRWNEDTFGILLNKTPITATERIFERITASLSTPIKLGVDNEEVELIPILGLAGRSNDTSFVELIDQAEYALEEASRRGAAPVLSSNISA